jgi:FixJ family two-component response regulator
VGAQLNPKPSILIIDDDPAVLGSLSFMLEAEGFNVCAVGSVCELLSCESISEHDCLVVDYWMPVMNGFDVLRWLRDRKVDAPAVMITARPEVKLRERALEAGFVRVVEKPLLDRALADDIRQVIASPK